MRKHIAYILYILMIIVFLLGCGNSGNRLQINLCEHTDLLSVDTGTRLETIEFGCIADFENEDGYLAGELEIRTTLEMPFDYIVDSLTGFKEGVYLSILSDYDIYGNKYSNESAYIWDFADHFTDTNYFRSYSSYDNKIYGFIGRYLDNPVCYDAINGCFIGENNVLDGHITALPIETFGTSNGFLLHIQESQIIHIYFINSGCSDIIANVSVDCAYGQRKSKVIIGDDNNLYLLLNIFTDIDRNEISSFLLILGNDLHNYHLYEVMNHEVRDFCIKDNMFTLLTDDSIYVVNRENFEVLKAIPVDNKYDSCYYVKGSLILDADDLYSHSQESVVTIYGVKDTDKAKDINRLVSHMDDSLITTTDNQIQSLNPETLEPIWWIDLEKEDLGDNPRVIWCDWRGVLVMSDTKLACFTE